MESDFPVTVNLWFDISIFLHLLDSRVFLKFASPPLASIDDQKVATIGKNVTSKNFMVATTYNQVDWTKLYFDGNVFPVFNTPSFGLRGTLSNLLPLRDFWGVTISSIKPWTAVKGNIVP
jgi:hypothetical protein